MHLPRRAVSSLLIASAAGIGACPGPSLAATRVFTVGYLSGQARGGELVQESFEAGARVRLETQMVSRARDGEAKVGRLDPARDVVALAPNFEPAILEALVGRARAARVAATGIHPVIPAGGLPSFSESDADANGRRTWRPRAPSGSPFRARPCCARRG
jgi:hypothetical protein